jgi:hypothetical protein
VAQAGDCPPLKPAQPATPVGCRLDQRHADLRCSREQRHVA